MPVSGPQYAIHPLTVDYMLGYRSGECGLRLGKPENESKDFICHHGGNCNRDLGNFKFHWHCEDDICRIGRTNSCCCFFGCPCYIFDRFIQIIFNQIIVFAGCLLRCWRCKRSPNIGAYLLPGTGQRYGSAVLGKSTNRCDSDVACFLLLRIGNPYDRCFTKYD